MILFLVIKVGRSSNDLLKLPFGTEICHSVFIYKESAQMPVEDISNHYDPA